MRRRSRPTMIRLLVIGSMVVALLGIRFEGGGGDLNHQSRSPASAETTVDGPEFEPAAPVLDTSGSAKRFANGAANRSPPYPLQRLNALWGLSDGSTGGGTVRRTPMPPRNEARCWGRTGEPAPVPTWVAGFLSSVGVEDDADESGRLPSLEAYRAIANATDAEPWAILIAWVPDRFMPPQPDGRTAAGRIKKAPTRGRDPQYYLQEYNASYHATATVDKDLKYHYQVVHRNAMAVCVRERLHVTALRCSPAAGEPIALLHHCLCRHCNEKVAVKVKGKGVPLRLPLHLPSPINAADGEEASAEPQLYRPLFLPSATVETNAFLRRESKALSAALLVPTTTAVPQKRGDKRRPSSVSTGSPPTGADEHCIRALSAPWLVPNVTVPRFAYEGLAQDLDRLLQVQADANRIVFVTIFNTAWVDHLHNWVFSVVNNANTSNFIVATLDPASLALCVENRLPCFDATAYAEEEEDDGADSHTRKVTEALSWVKPRLAVAVLERGYGFFLTDLDLSWNRRGVEDVLAANVDLAHQCDTPVRTSINSGFYLARPNVRTWTFFNDLMVLQPEEESDQTSMKLFARYDHLHGVSHVCLDRWIFNMKCNYKKPNSVKRKGGVETFEWIPFNRTRAGFTWRILHATCVSGAKAKVLYLRTMNAWFLDDLDARTATTKQHPSFSYCIVDPQGVRTTGHTAITVHSPKYPTGTDDTFLKTRH